MALRANFAPGWDSPSKFERQVCRTRSRPRRTLHLRSTTRRPIKTSKHLRLKPLRGPLALLSEEDHGHSRSSRRTRVCGGPPPRKRRSERTRTGGRPPPRTCGSRGPAANPSGRSVKANKWASRQSTWTRPSGCNQRGRSDLSPSELRGRPRLQDKRDDLGNSSAHGADRAGEPRWISASVRLPLSAGVSGSCGREGRKPTGCVPRWVDSRLRMRSCGIA
jgi:hypothetical protein